LNVDYQIPTEGEATLVVYDMTGKLLIEQSIANPDDRLQQVRIPVNQLHSGTYYLKVISTTSSEVIPFVKM